MAMSRDQSYLMAKYALITFTVLTLIATFVGYGVVTHEVTYLEDSGYYYYSRSYWRSWRAIIITYLVIEDIVALVGLYGAIKEHFRLTMTYGIVMTILWFFNFSNRALVNANVFNYLMSLGVIFSAFYFAKRIREKALIGCTISAPQVFVTPAPAVIQVSPSYVPNYNQTAYTTQTVQTAQYGPTEPTSTPPPPYAAPSQPQLQFKY